jgi:hypothetical protein
VPADVRPWRARVCRSHYVWLPPDDIQSAIHLRRDTLILSNNARNLVTQKS